MFETNGNAFAREMQEEAEKLEAQTKAMMERLTEETYEESQRLVPVDTGDLKDSADKQVSIIGAAPEGQVWYGAPYAAYVGLGTRYMPAQPYLWTLGPKLIKKALSDLAD